MPNRLQHFLSKPAGVAAPQEGGIAIAKIVRRRACEKAGKYIYTRQSIRALAIDGTMERETADVNKVKNTSHISASALPGFACSGRIRLLLFSSIFNVKVKEESHKIITMGFAI